MKKILLPIEAQKIINRYSELQIADKKIITPYFMNKKNKKGRRVSVGKGLPSEIEREVIKLAKKYNLNLYTSSAEKIKEFMIKNEIGIDCSGLAAWILNELVKEKVSKPIWKSLSFKMLSPMAQVKRHLRPIENVSVKVLTDMNNSIVVKRLLDIRVGDIIRVLNGHHILIVTIVEYDEKSNLSQFSFINSTMHLSEYYGIRKGLVQVTHKDKYLVDQKWIGDSWIFDSVKNFKEDSRIMRLKVLCSD